jgi:ATP-dependent DNA helicase RecG
MMIEDAQSFGLAQLHQLRGRIGRGDSQSYCVFVDTSDKKEVSERLKVMQETNDGFDIASKDLGLRGPGDVFGIRQSGELGFRVADIYNDAALLKKASEYISSAGSNAYSMLHSMTDDGAARVVL